MKTTIFKNIKETYTPFHRNVSFVLERIKSGRHKELIYSIRNEKDKEVRNELKKELPAICFSGTFSKRSDDAIIEHSGLICLDFDGYETESEMLSDKESISNDKYVMSVFISPSGNGLKVIVKIPEDIENHKRYFDALGEHFGSDKFDISTKNVSRVCYESYDPDIYVNMDSELWTTMADYDYRPVDRYNDRPTIPITDNNKIIEILLKWWSKKYPMVEGQRNNNAFILASALNEYGIAKSLAEYVIMNYASAGFSHSEIKVTVDSAYRNVRAHGTKYYEDDARMSKIRQKINRGESKDSIMEYTSDIDEDIVASVVKDIEKDSSIKRFWLKSDRGSISIVHYLFKEFLQHNGFYKFAPHGSMKYMLVKVTNNLIEKASEEEVKDFVLGYLEGLEDLSVYNFFADKTRFFKEDFLSLLDTVDVHFVEDTKTFSFIYFRNCALKVSVDDVIMVDYVDLDGYVWKDQIIDRDFQFCDITDCDFKQFVSNVSGDDDERIKSLESAIGFLMSGYKDPGFCPSVILNDEIISDEPRGGTGKGLFVQGISMMKKVAMIDGKGFSFDKPFAYQTITTDTQVISFDDVKKGFDFERLFSAITEGITIEKKNKDAIRIPFRFSPKIVITTNYTIRGRGNSFARRKFELELKQFYTKEFTPVDEFGKRLFDEWNDDEWCSFDNYMINNLRTFLSSGLVEAVSSNTALKRLAADTCHEFIEWAGLVEGTKPSDLIVYNERIFKDDLFMDFISYNPDFAANGKRTISRSTFYRWLNYYGDFNSSITTEDGRSNQGRWIIFKNEKYEKKEESKSKVIPGLEF
ncbi:MAG: BT4734/BF3469 family protein [Methylophilaceae bacterium]